MLVKENKYIPQEDRDFLILLRIGLWQRVEEDLSLSPDWNYIYTLACEQTVQGIIADGIGLYRKEHPDLNITQAENDRFLSASAQIVRRNHAINHLQARICKLFAEQNITYCVLKGQVVGQCYPKPMLRCSGDIDFLLHSNSYDNAKELLSGKADRIEQESSYLKHQGMLFGDLEIELHGTVNPMLGRNVARVLSQEQQKMFEEGVNFTRISETEVAKPSNVFHAYFIFAHCLKHYYNQALGLRQICDFAMVFNLYNS